MPTMASEAAVTAKTAAISNDVVFTICFTVLVVNLRPLASIHVNRLDSGKDAPID